MTPVWYCARTAPAKERAAAQILERKGWSVYLPTEIKWRRGNRFSRRKVPLLYPLFPRYLFVGFEPGFEPWMELLRLDAIQGIVGEDRPTPIPHSEIVRMQALYRSGAAVTATNVHRAFKVGDTVQVAYGPYVGHLVKITGLSGAKARIIAELFGAPREVEIQTAALEAA